MKTQSEVLTAFWQGMPQVWAKYRNKMQNDWPCDLHMELCDFVEMLHRDGFISDALADRVTG